MQLNQFLTGTYSIWIAQQLCFKVNGCIETYEVCVGRVFGRLGRHMSLPLFKELLGIVIVERFQ
jgi:hypothetical protein